MEIIGLTDEHIADAAAKAALALRDGGVVLYPTDTLYGLGADALSDEAVGKIYTVKGRDEGKPIHAIVSDIAMAEAFADVTNDARLLLSAFGGRVTVILKKKDGLDRGIAKHISSFGFRIPDNAFCIAMVRAFGGPITATSANRAGLETRRTVGEITEQLAGSAAGIALAIDAGELPPAKPSTVVDFSSGRPLILREGAILADEIWEVIR